MRTTIFNIASAAAITVAMPVHAQTNAAPLGLEIGKATCADARKVLAASSENRIGDDLLLTAVRPKEVFPDASRVLVRCSADAVIAVQLELPKGGMGAPGPREAYASLKKKYKQVGGGEMPTVGNGYARFAAGNTVIEQDAPHLSFEFTVTYYTKTFFESLRAANDAQDREARTKRDRGL